MTPGGPPPFFVVGAPRSGTTLMQQLLSRHPRVAVTPETHFVARFVGDDATHPRGSLAWEDLLDAVAGTPEFRDSGVDERVFRTACAATPGRRPRDVFAGWLECFAAQHGVDRVGEKTPNHLFAAGLLRDWFPGCRFVVVLRDPRAVVVSTGEVWWTAGSARGDARAWRRYEAALRRLQADARSSTDTVVVRYEALVGDPQSEADRVFALLGVASVDIAAGSGATAVGLDTDREPWKAGSDAAVTTSSRERWQTVLSATDLRAVESVCWHGMRRRGYTARTPTRQLATGILTEDALARARAVQLAVARRRR